MTRDDKLEGQIRAVLGAEAATRRVLAVRMPSRRAQAIGRVARLGSRAVPATLLVVLVAIAALGLADWRAQRQRSDEPRAVAGGIPGPLALGGGAPSLGFGLVSTQANTLLVRNEITETAPFTIPNALPQVAVSPNGHEIAYWLALPDRFSAGLVYQLHRADLLAPGSTICCAGLLMPAPAGQVPGPIVWSSDGTGLIVNTHAAVQRGPVDGKPNASDSAWFTVDLASGTATRITAKGFESVVSIVYAWDRPRDLITGSGLNAGQTTFTALQAGRLTNTAIPRGSMIAAADTFGRSLVLAYAGPCKGIGTTALCPTLEVRDQATFATITASPVGQATTDYPDVVFRPRSQDLIVQLPLQLGRAQVELWSDLGRGAHEVLASYSQSGRFTARRELILPRVDGSAVFLLKFDGSAGGRWFGEIVALAPDRQRSDFEIRTGGNPLASVVLDPAFAKAFQAPRSSVSPTPSARPTVDCGTVRATNGFPPYDQAVLDCVWASYTRGDPARLSLTMVTTEGDPVPTTILAVPGGRIEVTRDFTADKFSNSANRVVKTYSCTTISRRQWVTDPSRYIFDLSGCTGPSATETFP